VGSSHLDAHGFARYWPEFAQGDKGTISVPLAPAHRAGLPAIRRLLPDDAIYD